MDPRPLPVIDVREQVRLPLRRTFLLCVKGIRHRFFRSLLTSAVIVLAVAFFMALLAGSVFARAVAGGVEQERQEQRLAATALDAWFSRPSPAALARQLEQGGAEALARRTGRDPAALAALAEDCRAEASLLAWFESIDVGARVALVRNVRDRAILAWLAEPERWAGFAARLEAMSTLRPPVTPAGMQAVVARAPGLEGDLAALAGDHQAAVGRLETAVAGLSSRSDHEGRLEWLSGAEAGALAGFARLLAAHGLAAPEPGQLAAIQAGVRLQREREAVLRALAAESALAAWRRAFHDSPALDDKLRRLDDGRAAAVLEGAFPAALLTRLAVEARADARRGRVERALAGKVPEQGSLIGGRQLFLVAISFVVCMVGIANAMLMAITERFREIATMKCLGATDGYILTQFMMEAGLQGAAGGVLGTALGLLLALGKDAAAYGGHLFTWFPWAGTAGCALACLVAGVLLAVLASIYPSWLASRMAPMDAMRVE
jgi:hypothetical protein